MPLGDNRRKEVDHCAGLDKMKSRSQPTLRSTDCNAPFGFRVALVKSLSTGTVVNTDGGTAVAEDDQSESRTSINAGECSGKSHNRITDSDSEIVSALSSFHSHTGENPRCFGDNDVEAGEHRGGGSALSQPSSNGDMAEAANSSLAPAMVRLHAEEEFHRFSPLSCEPPPNVGISLPASSGSVTRRDSRSPSDASTLCEVISGNGSGICHGAAGDGHADGCVSRKVCKVKGDGGTKNVFQRVRKPPSVFQLPPSMSSTFVQIGVVKNVNLTVAVKQRVSPHTLPCMGTEAVLGGVYQPRIPPNFISRVGVADYNTSDIMPPWSMGTLGEFALGGCNGEIAGTCTAGSMEACLRGRNDMNSALHNVSKKLSAQSRPISSLSSTIEEGTTPRNHASDGKTEEEEEELMFVAVVKGKYQCKGYLTGLPNISVGTTVIVEGDRGDDIGTVQQLDYIEDVEQLLHVKVKMVDMVEEAEGCSSTVDETTTGVSDTPHEETVLDTCSLAHSDAHPTDDAMRFPRVLRLATPEDIAQLSTLRDEEADLLPNVRRVVNSFITKSTSAVGVTLVDIEFQFDKKKLTIYLRRPLETGFVNFRRMQRRFHRLLKCRIWLAYMDEVERQVAAYMWQAAPLVREPENLEVSKDHCTVAGELFVA